MTKHEVLRENMDVKFPYRDTLIPVVDGLEGFRDFTAEYPAFRFCPYVAEKTEDEWSMSTSRRYMNQVLPNFMYVPVNIDDGNEDELAQFIHYADENANIAAVNITKPHKSAPVLREYFFGNRLASDNVDTLIKNKDGTLRPFDLNAPAFVNWFEQDVAEFTGKRVIIVGVGGVGEPVAKHIDLQSPKSIDLVDPRDCTGFTESLSAPASYHSQLREVLSPEEDVILINASGKDGISDDTGLLEFIANTPSGIFVDLRPHLDIEIVEKAKELGWRAYTGHGMNARNDYELLTGIMDYLGVEASDRPSFEEFSAKVAAAS